MIIALWFVCVWSLSASLSCMHACILGGEITSIQIACTWARFLVVYLMGTVLFLDPSTPSFDKDYWTMTHTHTNWNEFENHPSNKNSAWQSFYDAKVSSSTPNKLGCTNFDSYMRGRESVRESVRVSDPQRLLHFQWLLESGKDSPMLIVVVVVDI
jgi:hypothetical protein